MWRLIALALLPGSCVGQTAVRGVPRKEWASYHAGGDVFHCRDGTASMPIGQLNGELRCLVLVSGLPACNL